MTSGIALMCRKDRHGVMQAYLDCGYRDFGITIHGNAAHHDEIVRRESAFRIAIEAAEFMKSCGAEVGVSLIELAPTVHLGPAASALEKKGIRTELGDHNRAVKLI